jgi:hypothetical protein
LAKFGATFTSKLRGRLKGLVGFIDENGGGPGVRLRKRHQKKS